MWLEVKYQAYDHFVKSKEKVPLLIFRFILVWLTKTSDQLSSLFSDSILII